MTDGREEKVNSQRRAHARLQPAARAREFDRLAGCSRRPFRPFLESDGRRLLAGAAAAGRVGGGGWRSGSGGGSSSKHQAGPFFTAAAFSGGQSLGAAGPQPGCPGSLHAVQRDPFLGAPGRRGSEVEPAHDAVRCAGLCCYEGRGGMCSIRLSEPLLKLRPRKDLVETLLHEMIHALLFVTHNNKDHDSHGPEFCKHMHRINHLTGANITIYHEFHDEVDSYRQHWWRCNGPCQSRKPYFGYVKRAMNRAPSANDFWWSEHQQTCGGIFTKIKEPENYSKKGTEKNQGKLPDDDKGRAHGGGKQSIIPFSGKGFVLGVRSGGSSLEKTTSPDSSKYRELLSSQQNSSFGFKGLNPKKETEAEPSVSCTDTCCTLPCNGKSSHASTITLPKVSVANTKAYTNVNGSPIRKNSFNVGKARLFSTNAKYISPPLKETQKRTLPEPIVSTPGCQTTFQGNSSMHDYGVPQKQAKMEDKSAFANYFIKKSSPGQTSLSVKNKDESTSCEYSATSTSDQTRKVSCPVCHSQVLEAKINEHLDSCL